MTRLWFVDQLCETLKVQWAKAKRICYDKQQNANKVVKIQVYHSLPVYCPKRRNFKYRCAIRAWDASISAMATNLWSLFGLWVKCAKWFWSAHETSWDSMNSQLVSEWCHHCCSLLFNSKPGLSYDLALLTDGPLKMYELIIGLNREDLSGTIWTTLLLFWFNAASD